MQHQVRRPHLLCRLDIAHVASTVTGWACKLCASPLTWLCQHLIEIPLATAVATEQGAPLTYIPAVDDGDVVDVRV